MAYFVVLIIIGNLVLLNLFLAILINNFMTNRRKDQSISETVIAYSLSKLRFTFAVRDWLQKAVQVQPQLRNNQQGAASKMKIQVLQALPE